MLCAPRTTAGRQILWPTTRCVRAFLHKRDESRPFPGPDLDTAELRGRLTLRMGISILDAIPCGVIRADEVPRPYTGRDAQGVPFHCLAGQDTPVVSDQTIAWMLRSWDRPLDRRFAEQLDTPM